MKLISINKIEDGMILAEDVLNAQGTIYLNDGKELNVSHVGLLENIGVDYIYIQSDEGVTPQLETNVEPNYTQEFKQTLRAFKNFYTRVSVGDTAVISAIEESLEPLVEGILNNNDILGNLRKIEIVDEYTFMHSINVSLIASMIGKWLGFDFNQLHMLSVAGLMHDIGKSQIPLEILNKPGKLTGEEFSIIKNHATLSYEIIKDIATIDNAVKMAVLQHHERMDGKGYPLGLKRDAIHPFAKILAVADVFDAMTSDRCYHDKETPYAVAERLLAMSADHLDIAVVSLFVNNISKFFVGNRVVLNNGQVGEVVLINPSQVTRPLVMTPDNYYDLSKDYSIDIVDMLS